MKQIVFGLLIFAGLSSAQQMLNDDFHQKRWFTCEMRNGFFWEDLTGSYNWHSIFLNGFLEAEAAYATTPVWPAGATAGEMEVSLTQFYGEAANRRVPILVALGYTKMRLSGASSEALAQYIGEARQLEQHGCKWEESSSGSKKPSSRSNGAD